MIVGVWWLHRQTPTKKRSAGKELFFSYAGGFAANIREKAGLGRSPKRGF